MAPVTTEHRLRTFEQTLKSARRTMVMSEILKLALDSFRASKVRFMLTALGMVIGTASVILVVTIGLTGKQFILNEIQKIGTNEVEVEYAGGGASGSGASSTTTPLLAKMKKRFSPRSPASCTPRPFSRCMSASASAAAWSRTRWSWASVPNTATSAT